jgi:PAS domain-containing protein
MMNPSNAQARRTRLRKAMVPPDTAKMIPAEGPASGSGADNALARVILASIGEAVIATDPAGLINTINTEAEHLTG